MEQDAAARIKIVSKDAGVERGGACSATGHAPSSIEVSAPAAGAIVVAVAELAAYRLSCGVVRALVEPALNPYQPTHKTRTPESTEETSCGSKSCARRGSYRPLREPTIKTPMRAEAPPTQCTTVLPAKSWKGGSSWESHPPPHVHRTAREKGTPEMKTARTR